MEPMEQELDDGPPMMKTISLTAEVLRQFSLSEQTRDPLNKAKDVADISKEQGPMYVIPPRDRESFECEASTATGEWNSSATPNRGSSSGLYTGGSERRISTASASAGGQSRRQSEHRVSIGSIASQLSIPATEDSFIYTREGRNDNPANSNLLYGLHPELRAHLHNSFRVFPNNFSADTGSRRNSAGNSYADNYGAFPAGDQPFPPIPEAERRASLGGQTEESNFTSVNTGTTSEDSDDDEEEVREDYSQFQLPTRAGEAEQGQVPRPSPPLTAPERLPAQTFAPQRAQRQPGQAQPPLRTPLPVGPVSGGWTGHRDDDGAAPSPTAAATRGGSKAALLAQPVTPGLQTPLAPGPVAAGCAAQASSASGSPSQGAQQPEAAKRTTVMMQNLPRSYTRDMLVELLNQEGLREDYDFLYLPIKFVTGMSFGYAFVNFTTLEGAERCHDKFEGFTRWVTEDDCVCSVSHETVHHGQEAHIQLYRNSPVMHESVPDNGKPAIYYKGVRVPFPSPTRTIRQPRPLVRQTRQ